MIGRLNHVAIAVPDLMEAAAQYKQMLGASVGEPQEEPDHGVTVILSNFQILKLSYYTRWVKTVLSMLFWKKILLEGYITYAMRFRILLKQEIT